MRSYIVVLNSDLQILACPSLSIQRLGLELSQVARDAYVLFPFPDPLRSLNNLLHQCWSDFSQIFAAESPFEGGTKENPANNEIYVLLTDRLNALVVLSPQVFLRLGNAATLRQPTLMAVYRILSLALWSCQRAIRCAGLRCLRYYVRTSEDVDVFLANRLDLFITRCLDLSYMEELLSILSIINGDSCSDERAEMQQDIRRLGGPYQRLLDGSKRPVGNIGFQRPFHEAPRTAATDTTERLAVIRLAFHLLRLSVRAFSPDLVHGLAAASTLTPAAVAHPSELNLNREVGGEAPLPFSHLSSQINANRDGDVCLRSYLLLLTEFVMRSSETHMRRCGERSGPPISAAPCCCPLEVAVKSLLSALPCCGEPGEVYKHSAQIFETILLALLRLSAESQYGRQVVDSWVFQVKIVLISILKCVSPFLVTYPLVTIPRSPYDSYVAFLVVYGSSSPMNRNPSFVAATRDSLVFVLRSWSGLFYFLREGRSCLHTLTQSLLLGSSKLRALVLNVLYNLFPGVPAPTLTSPADDTANAIAGGLSLALYTALPYPPASHHQEGRQQQQQSSFPYLDGDFVVEEGLRLFPLVQSAGTDILEAHSALLLCSFAQAGLFEALIAAVDDTSLYVSAAAGQLLGMLSFRANSQLHPDSLCMERLTNIPLLRDKFRAVDFLDRVHQILMERHLAGTRPILSAPLISPFLECLSRQQRAPTALTPPSMQTSAGIKGTDTGVFSPTQKTSVLQPTDSLLEAVIASSGVCASPTTNTATVQPLSGGPLTTTSTLGKSVSFSHSSVLGTPGATPVLSSPYEWDWGVLASWARKLSFAPGLFSWKDQKSQIFLTRLIDFITPNLEVLSLSLEVAYPTGAPPLYPLLSKSVNNQEDAFPLSPAYLRLLGRRSADDSSAFSPNSGVIPSLPWTSRNWPQAWAAATLLSGLLPHLSLYPPDSFPGMQLRRFLTSVHTCLAAAATPSASPMTCTHLLFQPSHLREHCSSLLLFGLGRLFSCEAGSSLLHAMEIPDLLTLIVGGSAGGQELQALKFSNALKNLRKQRLLCAKFLLPSMTYTGSGFGRSLLVTVCASGHTALRLFGAKFIRLLLRFNIPSTASWLVPLLLNLSCDRSPKEACLNPTYLQALLDYMQTGDGFADKRCCAAFPSPLLRLLSIGSLPSQRVIACLLAKSAWMLKVVSTPKPVASMPPLAVYPGGGIDGTLLEGILRAWMEIYNEQFAENIENRLMNCFRLPFLQNYNESVTSDLCPKFLQRCPSCNHPLGSDQEVDKKVTGAEEEIEEEDLFLDRQSNRVFSHFDEVAGVEVKLGTEEDGKESEVTFDFSPVAVQFFYRHNGSLFVPLHLFYCLALQETGFRVLRDNGYLATLADTLSQSCHSVTDSDGGSRQDATHIKAAIWALVSILVTPYGSRWVRASSVLQDIFWLIANADSLSVRGTAWLGVCFVSSSVHGGNLLRPWMVGGGGKGGTNTEVKMMTEGVWLLSTTDRDAHMWPLRERRVLHLNSQASERVVEASFASPTSPSMNRISYPGHGRSSTSFSEFLPFLETGTYQRNAHSSIFSLGCFYDPADSNLITAPTTADTVVASAVTASPSVHSPSSASMTEGKATRPLDHFLRPVRWIARRAVHSFRGQRGGGGRGVASDLSTDHLNGDESATVATVGEGRERTVSATSANSGHAVGDGISTMVQSLSSPDWFHSTHTSDSATLSGVTENGFITSIYHFLPFGGSSSILWVSFSSLICGCFCSDSKSASASPIGTPVVTANSPHFGLTDIFVFRGLFLPADVSILGKNFFSCSPTSHRRTIAHPFNGQVSPHIFAVFHLVSLPFDVCLSFVPIRPILSSDEASQTKKDITDGRSVDGDGDKKPEGALFDCIKKLCISEACRRGNSPCPKLAEDAEVESWRREVVEEVKNLMNSLLLGRVCTNLLALSHRASTGILRDGRRRDFASACLHTEVAQILFSYRYSRLARTLVQVFLGQFPPSNEVCSDLSC
ncbi:unnamed protein product [Hydatigera taeniaeformis]|uniref:RICTOR_N domain-containing protein n=1 Tax=Hydatigena taeniaeformis TaxID=6205 RepID=A0A0R3X1V8_HYDTA|nr:unnamed protein product [Hydatigera taeniaeformis]